MKRPNSPADLPNRSRHIARARLSRVLLGFAAAGGILLSAHVAPACDYCDSVELDCDACDGMSCDGMSCDGIGGRRCFGGRRIFRALDAVAGGVEKIMGFDKCGQISCGCDSLSCDGGCDACLSGEMMMPMAPVEMGNAHSTQVHRHGAPLPPISPSRTYSAPRVPPPVAAPMGSPRTVHPSPQFRMSEPMIVSPQAATHQIAPMTNDQMEFDALESDLDAGFGPAPQMSQPRMLQPREMHFRETPPAPAVPVDRLPSVNPAPAEAPAPKNEGGSLFDALDDPFGDDVRVTPRNRLQIQPSNYRRTPLSQPIRLRAPQASSRSILQRNTPVATTQAQPTGSYAARSSANVSAPLRRGSSFRSLNEAATSGRTSTRQASHQNAPQTRQGSAAATMPRLAPAPAPRQINRTQQSTRMQQSTVRQTSASQTPVRRLQTGHPQTGQMTGQRHSTAGYSGYGHTTSRR